MRAAQFYGDERVETVELSDPSPAPHQIVVKLEGCGICNSSYPVWEGREWFSYPLTAGAPGHEGWGRVAALGKTVKNLRVGDKVAVLSQQAFSEYDVADADSVALLPNELTNQPFPAEAVGCAMNIWARAEVKPGQRVAIVGVGFLGALLIELAKNASAEVIAVSRRQFSLQIAKERGADLKLPMNESTVGLVEEHTSGKMCERVIEAVGNQAALDLASKIVGERGKLVIAGYHQEGLRTVNLQEWNWKGIDVINAHEREFGQYVSGIKAGILATCQDLIHPQTLITHTFPIEKVSEGFAMMRDRPDGFVKGAMTNAA